MKKKYNLYVGIREKIHTRTRTQKPVATSVFTHKCDSAFISINLFVQVIPLPIYYVRPTPTPAL